MSLVGNLEDLSLGDIMQIISLSQKSGVLVLKGAEGSGRIVFREGLIRGATVNGAPKDIRELLTLGGLIDGPTFDDLAARAEQHGLPVEQTIAVEGGLSLEQIDAQLQAAVEAAVLEMFSWPSGDFSFDVRSEVESDDPRLILAAGLNAQYLAMEGMRILDERSRGPADGDAAADIVANTSVDTAAGAGEDAGGASSEIGSDWADLLPSDEAIFEDAASSADDATEADDDAEREQISAADVLVASVVSGENEITPAEVEPEPEPATSSTRMIPVVLINPDVASLEWVKTAIQDDFARIHVFQQADQGLARIRQYLIRGELPVVMISTEISIDPLSGIHGLPDFVQRLKTQASRLVVVGVCPRKSEAKSSNAGPFDGFLVQPNESEIRESETDGPSMAGQAMRASLQQILAECDANPTEATVGQVAPKSASVQDLRDATEKLLDASSRGAVLPVVMDFSAELFARVAILIVREDQVFAIAGRGIAALEVDPLDSKPPVALQALENGWVQTVLQSCKPIRSSANTPADHELLARLGGDTPDEIYLGPIESGGSMIALLYGDQASVTDPMPDTSALEVVLHHAALALDRAALERALWEAEEAGRNQEPQGNTPDR